MKEEEWTDRCERYFTSIANCEKKDVSTVETNAAPSVERRKEKYEGKILPPFMNWVSLIDLHCASLIGNTKSLPVLIFWVIVCATGLSSLTYLISVRVAYYMTSGSHFVLTSTDNHRQPRYTPLTLSMCNLNILRKSTIRGSRLEGLLDITEPRNFSIKIDPSDINGKLEDFSRFFGASMLVKSSREEYEQFKGIDSPKDWSAVYENAMAGDLRALRYALRLSRDELQHHGMRLHEDLLHCWKDGKSCNKNIQSYQTSGHHGNCLEINLSESLNEAFETLAVILNTRPEEYLGLMTPSLGFKVRVHAGFNQSGPVEEFLVSPGNTLKLNLRKVSMYHRDNCKSENGYSYKHCQQECLEKLSRDMCGCSPSIDADLADRCQLHLEYQYVCVRVLEKMSSLGTLPCTCDKDCRDVEYTITASSISWPSNPHQEHLLKSLKRSGYHGNGHDLRKELVHIEFTAQSTNYQEYREQEDVTILSLLIEVGGLSALLCGLSLITCLEILVGVCKVLIKAYSQVFQRNVEKDGVQRLNDADVNTITWSQKGASQDNAKKLQSSTTLLSSLTLGQSFLDPIKEVDTPRTEDHTYEAIYSRISPREPSSDHDQTGKTTEKSASHDRGTSSRARKQWNSIDGATSGRERWRKPTFPRMDKTGLENKVFYGSNDELNKYFSKPADDRCDWDGFNTMPSPRRMRWPERPPIPPLNFTKMQNADGFWMRNGKLVSSDEYFKRRGSGSNVLTWSDFSKQYGVPKLHDNNDKTKSKNIFYM